MLFSHLFLKEFIEKVFIELGSSKENASLAAEVLNQADLRGVDSHGIARLKGYVNLYEAKRVNLNPSIKVVHETPSTALLDGDEGLGLVTAPEGMDIAINKAKEVGTGWVAIKNSNHFGIAAYHAMMALPHDMIGFAMTNASPLVAPTHTTERLLGTNPIAVAIPAMYQPPFVADFATTTVANGKLEILQRKKENAPDGWVQDACGKVSNDPNILKAGGALLPLGSLPELGSHKGYCLGAIVDILSGVLSGANFGPWVPPFVSFLPIADNLVGEGIGHFVGAIRVDAFQPAEVFKKRMDQWINRFREAKPITESEEVLIPGDLERNMSERRLQEGIPLLDEVIKDLELISEKLSIPFL